MSITGPGSEPVPGDVAVGAGSGVARCLSPLSFNLGSLFAFSHTKSVLQNTSAGWTDHRDKPRSNKGPVSNLNVSRDLCGTVNSKAGYIDASSKVYSFGVGEVRTGNSNA